MPVRMPRSPNRRTDGSMVHVVLRARGRITAPPPTLTLYLSMPRPAYHAVSSHLCMLNDCIICISHNDVRKFHTALQGTPIFNTLS